MGVVFLAWDRDESREVALKVVRRSWQQHSDSEGQRFLREIQNLAALEHPHIVQFYRAGEEEYRGRKALYYTMEWVDGYLLTEELSGTTSLDWTFEMIGDLASAMAYIHRREIVHRDLKPANIMIDPQGSPRLLDFGLSRLYRESESFRPTYSRALLGTPQYMSPEQFHDPRQVSQRSDLFSLGAILFHLLTGSLVVSDLVEWRFRKKEDLEDLHRVFAEKNWSLPEVDHPRIDGEMADILKKTLAWSVEDRYPQVESFSEDLKGYLDRRKEWKHQFFLDEKGESWEFTHKIELKLDDEGQIRIGGDRGVLYGRVVNLLSRCQIFVEVPLQVNGRLYREKEHIELHDGDCIALGDEKCYYRRGPHSEFYRKEDIAR